MKKIEHTRKASWGSKALNLALMQEQGLPVPAFSVYRCEFFTEPMTLEYLKLQQSVLESGQSDLADVSKKLQAWATDKVMSESFEAVSEYRKASESDRNIDLAAELLPVTYSVRSSATVEDQVGTSFAGQFSTKLNVQAADLEEAIAETVASLYSISALSYLLHHDIQLDAAEMLVIIQEMVVGEVSGVYFTANPQGILNEHVLVLGHGIGDQVVEDKVPTTTLTYYPTDDLTYYETWEDSPIPNEQQIKALKQMSREVTKLFGPRLDIEFSFVQNKLFVLQVRPITTFPKGQLNPAVILDNSNIVESYPGTTTPLTFSFIQEAYASVFRGLGRRIVGNKTPVEKHILTAYEGTFEEMIAMVNSRVYYQIKNWYQLLQLLPFSKRIIPIWQNMLGVRQTDVPVTPVHISGWQRVKFSMHMIKEFLKAPKQMAQLAVDFQTIENVFEKEYVADAEIEQLQRLFEEIKEAVLDQWDITLVNDLYAFVYTGLFRKLNKKRPEAELELAGIEQIESMKPARALHELAKAVQANTKFKNQLLQLEAKQVAEFLANDQQLLTLEIEDYRKRYGNRVPEELKLETQTYQTHPEKLIEAILSYQISDFNIPTVQVASLTSRNPLKNYVKKQALLGIQYRESSRLNRTRIYGMMRQIFLTIGERLVETGQLDLVEDVFWLEMNELFSLRQSSQETLSLVKERKQKRALDQQLPAVSRFVYVEEIIEKYVRSVNVSETFSKQLEFRGIACSKGQVRGEVIRIDDISQMSAKDTLGKIIVTRMTDPGWVHLLTQAKGIVAERGSLLSHTAIISRELGIPSIVNVPGIMSAIQTGDLIELDGQAGTVRKLVKGEGEGSEGGERNND